MKKLTALLLCLLLMLPLTPAALADEGDEGVSEEITEEVPEEPWEPPAEDPPADDGDDLEYGVYPSDPEQPDEPPSEPEDEDTQPETPEPAAVRVIFRCDPPEASVTVYERSLLPGGGWTLLAAVWGDSLLLLPGDYVYDAVCEGYASVYQAAFTVYPPSASEAEPEQLVSVFLEAEESAPSDAELLRTRREAPEPLVTQPLPPGAALRTPKVFTQTDSRWAACPYPYSSGLGESSIAVGGCGLLALTNAVYDLNGCFIDPVLAGDYAAEAGFHSSGGTKWDFYRNFAQKYGESFGFEFAGEADSFEALRDALQNGCAAICSVPGHMMALVDYDASLGRYLLLDSSPDEIRATDAGYAWLTEKELCVIPSIPYEYEGLYPRFVLLRAVGRLEVRMLLDGAECADPDGCGSFDVWVDGEKLADDCTSYRASLPQGAAYRVDDIRPQAGRVWYGVRAGSTEGIVRGAATAQLLLAFGTKDSVSQRFAAGETETAPASQASLPAVCVSWTGGVVGPGLRLPLPKA